MEALLTLDRDRFDRELLRRGLTARKLARAAGVDETQVSQYRTGRRRLRAETLRKLANALASFPTLPGANLLLPEEAEG